MYKHLLVTLDGSEASEAVLSEAAMLASDGGVKVTLFRVAESAEGTRQGGERPVASGPFSPGTAVGGSEPHVEEDRGQALERTKDEASTYLAKTAHRLKEQGVQVDTRVSLGDPGEEILSAAEAVGADLIVMATHGRTGLARVVFGSVAEKVVGAGKRPVLLLRPPKLG